LQWQFIKSYKRTLREGVQEYTTHGPDTHWGPGGWKYACSVCL